MWLVAPVLDIQNGLLDIASLETSEAQTMQSGNPPAYYINTPTNKYTCHDEP